MRERGRINVTNPLKLHVVLERWPLASPFRTAAHTVVALDVIRVELAGEGHTGRGEAAGVFYKQDTPARALDQIQSLQGTIEAGISRDSLQRLLRPCG